MWASSRVEFLSPLPVGAAIERRSRIASITEKQGGTGALVFVEIAHATHADDAVAVRETQTLVFREAALADSPPATPPPAGGRLRSAAGRVGEGSVKTCTSRWQASH